jgi:cold shock CspA family protein
MIGRITYWNNPKGFGFVTVANTDGNGTFQTQYFFHHSNFKDGETAVLGGIVVFNLGEPVAIGKKIQAVGVRYATPAEIEQTNYIRSFTAGTDALKSEVCS